MQWWWLVPFRVLPPHLIFRSFRCETLLVVIFFLLTTWLQIHIQSGAERSALFHWKKARRKVRIFQTESSRRYILGINRRETKHLWSHPPITPRIQLTRPPNRQTRGRNSFLYLFDEVSVTATPSYRRGTKNQAFFECVGRLSLRVSTCNDLLSRKTLKKNVIGNETAGRHYYNLWKEENPRWDSAGRTIFFRAESWPRP